MQVSFHRDGQLFASVLLLGIVQRIDETLISTRTRAALAAKKARGERLGNPNIGNRILHAVMKARDIGLEGFNAPADLNALHVWQLAGRKATIRLKRDREFADSPVEGAGFELPVPQQIRSHF